MQTWAAGLSVSALRAGRARHRGGGKLEARASPPNGRALPQGPPQGRSHARRIVVGPSKLHLCASTREVRPRIATIERRKREAVLIYRASGLTRTRQPVSFTQEDPIGLAGGLNLYGFASGDPVNFSDPFGLCPNCGTALIGAAVFGGIRAVSNYLNDRPLTEGLVEDMVVGAAIGFTLGAATPALVARGGIAAASIAEGTATAGAAAGGAAAPRLTIQFGRVANQVEHAFRHTDELGLDRSAVQAAIEQHLPTVVSQMAPGKPLNQIITVDGQRIQYTAFEIAKGVINVGRIHGAP